jgi:hypothetical protein
MYRSKLVFPALFTQLPTCLTLGSGALWSAAAVSF